MFSIGLPAYKAKFLKQAINCILNQSYKEFELIIVNDASPENISAIVSTFCDSRIKYYENDINYGQLSVVKNWNKCLEYATKEYFILFSDDDICDERMLEEYANLIKKYPRVNILHSRIKVIDEESNPIYYGAGIPEYESSLDFVWHRISFIRRQFISEFVYKTFELKSKGGFIDFPLAWCSDDATNFLLSKENGIVASNRFLVSWRLSRYNISHLGSSINKMQSIQLFKIWLSDFINTYPDNEEKDIILSNLKNYYYNLERDVFNKFIKSCSLSSAIISLFKREFYTIKFSHKIISLIKKVFI